MSEAIHADIFFFITSIVTILIGGAVLVVLYYVIRIVRDLREIVGKLNRASHELERDFEEFRSAVKSEGTKVRTVADMALSFIIERMRAYKPRVRKAKPKEPPTEETELQ